MKNILFCLLALWVAVQSVLAAADAHQAHQSDAAYHPIAVEHLQAPSADQQPAPQINDAATDQSLNTVIPLDCQHCCHCNGQLAKLLAYSIFNSNFYIAEAPFGDYRHTLLSAHPSSLFRPPRV